MNSNTNKPKEGLGEQILSKINTENIRPRPRWQCVCKRYSFKTLAISSLLLGTASFALVTHLIINQDWDAFSGTGDNFFRWLFLSLPYAWILFLILFIIGTYVNFRHFRTSYKYPGYIIFLVAITIMVLFGGLAVHFGLQARLHRVLSERVPFYQNVFDSRVPAWQDHNRGFLAGMIISYDQKIISLQDFQRKTWLVQVRPETLVRDGCYLSPGEMIKIIGSKQEGKNFTAKEIRAWDNFGPPPMPGRGRGQMRYLSPPSN